MSTTAKIDFEPGLFDEGQPEAAPTYPQAPAIFLIIKISLFSSSRGAVFWP